MGLLYPAAIKASFNVDIEVTDGRNPDGKATPRVFYEAYSAQQNYDGVMSDTKAKSRLANQAFPQMTAQMIAERDPAGEVRGWFEKIRELVEQS